MKHFLLDHGLVLQRTTLCHSEPSSARNPDELADPSGFLTSFGMTKGGDAASWLVHFSCQSFVSRMITFLALLLLIFVLKVGTAVAQSEIMAKMTAVQPVAHIGEAIELTVTVGHPTGWRVIAPQLEQEWGNFEVREQSPVMVMTGNDGESSQFTIMVMAWTLGEFSTPELALTVANEVGELVEVTAVPVTIRVESVLTEADLELRDIKPQATLPLPVWWPWLAGALALVAVLAVVWWRGRGRATAVPFIDTRLPHQIALDELDSIAASGLAERGDFKHYYAQTTDVLRGYLDGTLGLMTLEQTTREIRQAIRPLAWENEDKKLLLNLLNEADLVKFAKVRPTVEDAQRATGEAKAFVMAVKGDLLTNGKEHERGVE